MTYSAQLIEKRDSELAKADALVSAASADSRALTTEEDAQVVSTLDIVRDLDEQIKRHAELEARNSAAVEARKKSGIETVVSQTQVKSEPRTYAPQAKTSFIRDAYAAQFSNDFSAQERLARHMNEELI